MAKMQQYRKYFLILGLCLLLSYLAVLGVGETLDNKLQDTFLQKVSPADTDIVIVGIDDPSLELIGRWPWPRYAHAELLRILSQGQPAVVGIDLIFSEAAADPEEDLALIEAVKECGNVVLPVYANLSGKAAGQGAIQTTDLVRPFPAYEGDFITGHINTFPDPDGIIRKTALYLDHDGEVVPSFAWRLYEQYLQSQQVQLPDIHTLPLDPIKRLEIAYTGMPGHYDSVSYHQVLSGEIAPEYFTGKAVLIGPYTVGIDDYYFTPLAPEVPMHGIEIHANILQNLIRQSYKQRPAGGAAFLIMLIAGALSAVAFNRLSPLKGVILLGALGVGYVLLAKEAYARGYVLAIFYPLLLLSLAYLVTLAANYILELLERRRITGVFSRYVAPQVVNQLLEGGEAALQLGGSRRDITVLFVDIRGFTPLSEAAAPEEVVEILNEYLTLVAEAIFRYGGTLDKFIGDAAMAIFNAPLDLPDHCFRAVQAAWAMKEGSKAMQSKLMERFGRNVQFGIGLNTGPAVVGNIGASFRMDYTAIGDTVNTAARLESNAKPGQILLSQALYEQVRERVLAENLGTISVKGKAQGVSIWQLEGLQ